MDLHSRKVAEEEHLDRNRMAELGRTHMQVAGVDKRLEGDTVHPEEPESLAATGAVARTLAPVGD